MSVFLEIWVLNRTVWDWALGAQSLGPVLLIILNYDKPTLEPIIVTPWESYYFGFLSGARMSFIHRRNCRCYAASYSTLGTKP